MFDAVVTAKALQVRLAHIGNKAVGGLGNGQQRFEVFRMAGAHLNDGDLGILPYFEHTQRNANIVVQVALRGHHAVFGSQDAADELLGGGFSVGTGKADHGNGELLPVVSAQCLQGGQGVRHLDEARIIGLHRVAHNGITSPLFQGLQGKGVAVKILPFQGHEKLVFPDGTGVCVHACTVQENVI